MFEDLEDISESNDFLNLLLDNIAAGVLIADGEGRIHRYNQTLLDLFERPEAAPIELLTRQTPADREPLTLEVEPGEERHLQVSTRPLLFRGREMVLVIIHDVTAEVNQRRELER